MLTFTRCSLWSNVLPCQFCEIVRSWPSEICLTMGWKPFLNFHSFMSLVQVNLCQKLFFLQNMGRTCRVQKLFWMSKTISVHNMFSPGSELEVFLYWTCNSMNNLSSYCGLVDAKIRASDKDLPVRRTYLLLKYWATVWTVDDAVFW